MDNNQYWFIHQQILCAFYRAHWHQFSLILFKKIKIKVKVNMIYRSLYVCERIDSKTLVLTCVFCGNLEPE